jgi:collagenase-like PrtC family protease
MHNHTAERVSFLEQVGFRRVILACELRFEQIRAIRAPTAIDLETSVRGALCVSYSGQCCMSYPVGGRRGAPSSAGAGTHSLTTTESP